MFAPLTWTLCAERLLLPRSFAWEGRASSRPTCLCELDVEGALSVFGQTPWPELSAASGNLLTNSPDCLKGAILEISQAAYDLKI
jgi:hypothetical protein